MTSEEYAEMAAQANAQGKILESDGQGGYILVDPPQPAVTVADYQAAVDNLLAQTAQSRGYDNAYTCLSYMNSTDQTWHNEAVTFNAWRDSVWRECHTILNQVQAGTREAPTIQGLLDLLPVIEW